MTAEFGRLQRDHHRQADPAHYRWQTEAPYFAATESALLTSVRASPRERLLEIGCGEGGNLRHLRTRLPEAQLFGVDFSVAKAAFAHAATGARIACAQAERLPFADGTFDAVLIRDLLHHLPDRRAALAEAHRVLKPGGRLTLVEPNRYSVLVLLQALMVRAERGLLNSSAAQVKRELDACGFEAVQTTFHQPMPIVRLLANPKFHSDALLSLGLLRAGFQAFDRFAASLIPEAAWLYFTFEAVRK